MAAETAAEAHPDVRAVADVLGAWSAGAFETDFDGAYSRLFTPTCVLSLPRSSVATGKAGVAAWCRELAALRFTKFAPRMSPICDGIVSMRLDVAGSVRSSGAAFADCSLLAMWTVEDGKVDGVEFFSGNVFENFDAYFKPAVATATAAATAAATAEGGK
jgi:hypothetical protein